MITKEEMTVFAEFIEKAGPLAWMLLPISFIGFTLVLDRSAFWGAYLLSRRLRRRLTSRVRAGEVTESERRTVERCRDPLPHVLLRLRDAGGRGDLVSSGIRQEFERARSGTGLLATLTELSPSVGLFGTVWGVTRLLPAYHASDIGGVVEGLSTALYTTIGGLALFLVFAPAVFLFEGAAERLRLRLETEVEAVSRPREVRP